MEVKPTVVEVRPESELDRLAWHLHVSKHRLAGRLSAPPIQAGLEAAQLQQAARVALRSLDGIAVATARFKAAKAIALHEDISLEQAIELVAGVLNRYELHLAEGGRW